MTGDGGEREPRPRQSSRSEAPRGRCEASASGTNTVPALASAQEHRRTCAGTAPAWAGAPPPFRCLRETLGDLRCRAGWGEDAGCAGRARAEESQRLQPSLGLALQGRWHADRSRSRICWTAWLRPDSNAS